MHIFLFNFAFIKKDPYAKKVQKLYREDVFK